ncbi:ATP-binding protein [Candidatus Foliamicus sp.]
MFEAVVNAVAHRDYSMSARMIRLSMFKDRLEIDSPGRLPNGMTIEGMEASQATRNETIASVFGRIPVARVAGSDHRRYLMERRGDGVSIIRKETEEATGMPPQYEIVDESSLVLRIPAAKLELVPADATVTVHSGGEPLAGIEVLALFPNKTWVQAFTDETGEAALDLYTTHLPMTVYAAGRRYRAGLKRAWTPNRGGLLLELEPLGAGGAVIFTQGTGRLPGLRGRLNPIRDNSDRTYLYADNIAIDEGRQQPVPFLLGKPIRLTDAHGTERTVAIVDIVGQSVLIEYRPFEP